jgi:hypothetical protein
MASFVVGSDMLTFDTTLGTNTIRFLSNGSNTILRGQDVTSAMAVFGSLSPPRIEISPEITSFTDDTFLDKTVSEIHYLPGSRLIEIAVESARQMILDQDLSNQGDESLSVETIEEVEPVE